MLRVTSVILLIAFSAVILAEEDKYPDKYDYIDVDAILANPRQRDSYYKCFSGLGACVTADAKFFKDRYLEALTNKCKKCTDKQIEHFNKITDWYTANEPEKYKAVIETAINRIRSKSS